MWACIQSCRYQLSVHPGQATPVFCPSWAAQASISHPTVPLVSQFYYQWTLAVSLDRQRALSKSVLSVWSLVFMVQGCSFSSFTSPTICVSWMMFSTYPLMVSQHLPLAMMFRSPGLKVWCCSRVRFSWIAGENCASPASSFSALGFFQFAELIFQGLKRCWMMIVEHSEDCWMFWSQKEFCNLTTTLHFLVSLPMGSQ